MGKIPSSVANVIFKGTTLPSREKRKGQMGPKQARFHIGRSLHPSRKTQSPKEHNPTLECAVNNHVAFRCRVAMSMSYPVKTQEKWGRRRQAQTETTAR